MWTVLAFGALAVGARVGAPGIEVHSGSGTSPLRHLVDPVTRVRIELPRGWVREPLHLPSPDGRYIAFSNVQNNPATNAYLYLRPVDENDDGHTYIASAESGIAAWWAPDSDSLFVRADDGFGSSALYRMRIDTMQRFDVVPQGRGMNVLAGAAGVAVAYDTNNGARLQFVPWNSRPTLVTDDLHGQWAVDWSADGTRLAYAVGIGGAVHIMDEGRVDGLFARDLAWSPRGEVLAVVGLAGAALWDADNGVRALGPATSVHWSPDGARLIVEQDEGLQLVTLGAHGGLATELIHSGESVRLSWSPDGTWLGFMDADADGVLQVFGLDLDRKKLVQITENLNLNRFGGWAN